MATGEPRWSGEEDGQGRVIDLRPSGVVTSSSTGAGGRLLVTPEIASDLLCIGRTKLYELLASGDIESVRLGSCRRIPIQALEDFVSRLRRSRRPPGVTAGRDDFGASEIGGGV